MMKIWIIIPSSLVCRSISLMRNNITRNGLAGLYCDTVLIRIQKQPNCKKKEKKKTVWPCLKWPMWKRWKSKGNSCEMAVMVWVNSKNLNNSDSSQFVLPSTYAITAISWLPLWFHNFSHQLIWQGNTVFYS